MSVKTNMLAVFSCVFMMSALSSAAKADVPSSCSLSSLAGKWIWFKTNLTYQNSSKCVLVVDSAGKFTGDKSCFDYAWQYKGSAYSINGTITMLPAVNSCYVSIKATAGGSVKIAAEGAVNAGKDEISGFFTNSIPAVGPLSLIKVP